MKEYEMIVIGGGAAGLSAAIEALSAIEEGTSALLYTDSQYMKNAFTKHWITNWKRNGWKTANKKSVENQDLWNELIVQTRIHRINWNKVKGHADDELNNRCDKLATDEAAKLKKHMAESSNAD